MRVVLQVLVLAVIASQMVGSLLAAEVRLAVTTSFNNSGLSDVLLPVIKTDLGLDVRLLVVGTGQALKLGEAGDVDAILVHSKTAEEAFIANGFATHRREIMYNDFVFVGPSNDPARISEIKSASQALQAIATTRHAFVSRGDDSGTHKKEVALWKAAEINPADLAPSWYREVGAGMGAALNTASGMNAYIMSDRASWLNFANKGELKLLLDGDPVLFNQYAYLPVNPSKHLHVESSAAEMLEGWLVSKKGQALIGAYTIGGQTLFTPNAE